MRNGEAVSLRRRRTGQVNHEGVVLLHIDCGWRRALDGKRAVVNQPPVQSRDDWLQGTAGRKPDPGRDILRKLMNPRFASAGWDRGLCVARHWHAFRLELFIADQTEPRQGVIAEQKENLRGLPG